MSSDDHRINLTKTTTAKEEEEEKSASDNSGEKSSLKKTIENRKRQRRKRGRGLFRNLTAARVEEPLLPSSSTSSSSDDDVCLPPHSPSPPPLTSDTTFYAETTNIDGKESFYERVHFLPVHHAASTTPSSSSSSSRSPSPLLSSLAFSSFSSSSPASSSTAPCLSMTRRVKVLLLWFVIFTAGVAFYSLIFFSYDENEGRTTGRASSSATSGWNWRFSSRFSGGGAPKGSWRRFFGGVNSPALPKERRKDSCRGCNRHNYKFVINNPGICDDPGADDYEDVFLIDISKNNEPSFTSPNGTIFHNLSTASISSNPAITPATNTASSPPRHRKPPPFMLMLIASRHRSRNARAAIRDTWAKLTRNNTSQIRAVFLFGVSLDPVLNELVQRESDRFGDVIMEDFVDSYENLTLKTMMGLKWASRYCAGAKFVYKVDDDMFVNTDNLLRYLRHQEGKRVGRQGSSKTMYTTSGSGVSSSLSSSSSSSFLSSFSFSSKLIGGRCCDGCSPIRNAKSKWYASFAAYPHSSYPRMCFGTSYLLSMDVAKRIFEASKDVPFFHLEDVYTTGLVANKHLGLKPISIPGMFNYRPPFKGCFYSSTLISSHAYNAQGIRDTWKKVRNLAGKCKAGSNDNNGEQPASDKQKKG